MLILRFVIRKAVDNSTRTFCLCFFVPYDTIDAIINGIARQPIVLFFRERFVAPKKTIEFIEKSRYNETFFP